MLSKPGLYANNVAMKSKFKLKAPVKCSNSYVSIALMNHGLHVKLFCFRKYASTINAVFWSIYVFRFLLRDCQNGCAGIKLCCFTKLARDH